MSKSICDDHSYSLPLTSQHLAANIANDHSYALTFDAQHSVKLLFWNVNGKKSFLDKIDQDCIDFLNNSDVVFLNETMEVKPSSCLANKDFFSIAAVETDGRPSGGLEMYVPSQMKPECISKSPQHICIETQKFYALGVYYKPSLELDEKITDLYNALIKCNDHKKMIALGGDFNLHYETPDFYHFSQFLLNFNLHLRSNPTEVTFLNHTGSSTPDHIFCSVPPGDCKATVIPKPQSWHFPTFISISTMASNTFPPVSKKLNINSCMQKLLVLNEIKDTISTEDLSKRLSSAFASSLIGHDMKANIKVQNNHIRELKQEVNQALKLYHRHKNPFFKNMYLTLRRELQKEILIDKRKTKESKVSQLIQDTMNNGIQALYKPARRNPFTTPMIPLHTQQKYLADLYQKFNEPLLFPPITTALSEDADYLLHPCTVSEIEKAISQQSSLAKGVEGTSPKDMKKLAPCLAPILTYIFNAALKDETSLADEWLSSMFFFVHKNGPCDDPANYRSLAIEDPILKIFTSFLCNRLNEFCEKRSLLPAFQFGFRKNLSTASATMILKNCIENCLGRGKRVHACFVDFKKAFDLVDRGLLSKKLQLLGIPYQFVKVIFETLQNIRFQVRSNNSLSDPFETHNGVPQGDPLSPLLFSLFIADLPKALSHDGVLLENQLKINYLLYADDLALVAESPEDLQQSLDDLKKYCDQSKLTVNIQKTKCLSFYKGYCPKFTFYFGEEPLVNCNQFTYLGVIFTTRLSAAKHIDYIVSKCRARIGYLFCKLPIPEIPLDTALSIFNVYVRPILTYALPVWLPQISKSYKTKINSLFTKFLKRFLGIPYCSNNAITHFITQTKPLISTLEDIAPNSFLKISYPSEISGIRFSPPSDLTVEEPIFSNVPTTFWLSETLNKIPMLPKPKRALMYDIYDIHHSHICETETFHTKINENDIICICKFCYSPMTAYHFRECSELNTLTPCQRIRKTTSSV